jgi:hypothetical protein
MTDAPPPPPPGPPSDEGAGTPPPSPPPQSPPPPPPPPPPPWSDSGAEQQPSWEPPAPPAWGQDQPTPPPAGWEPPPAGYAAPTAPLPYGATERQLGIPRKPWVVITYSIITLGIYALYWFFRQYEELFRYRGGGIEGGWGLLLSIFGATWFLLPRELEYVHQGEGQPAPISYQTGFWVLVPFAGLFIWMYRVQDTMNRFWLARGAPPP